MSFVSFFTLKCKKIDRWKKTVLNESDEKENHNAIEVSRNRRDDLDT